jgi:5-bromo-4-chloroindolyl phosphate hydrolysis protein
MKDITILKTILEEKVMPTANDFRLETTDACEILVKSIFDDIKRQPEKYLQKRVLFYGNLGSLMYCEVHLRALLHKNKISGLEICSNDESQDADFKFDVGEYVRMHFEKIGLEC